MHRLRVIASATACVLAGANEDGLNLLQLHTKYATVVSSSAIVGGPGEDAVKFCEAERLELTEPTENNLDGQIATADKLIRYPNVKAGVDLILEAGDGYEAVDSDQNGLKSGFGNINMRTGTTTRYTFTFVEAGTKNPVVVPQFSISFYDLDEGKKGRGRGTIQSCNVAASFIPASTELAQQLKDGCVKTTTCLRGKKRNEPPNPFALNDDHKKRTITMGYEGQSSFTVHLSLAKGTKGRNFMFAMTAVGACAKTTTTTTQPIPTTPPIPDCPPPSGAYKFCQCRRDPFCDSTFLEGRQGFYHMGIGIFWVAKTKNGDGIQVFQVPPTYRPSQGDTAIIAGIAVKIGDSTVTYTPTEYNWRENINPKAESAVKVMIGNEEFTSLTANKKISGGYVTTIPENLTKTSKGSVNVHGVCLGDDARTFQVKMKAKYPSLTEFHFEVNMQDAVMDDTVVDGGYGQICLDGGGGAGGLFDQPHLAESASTANYTKRQRVKFNESFFGWRELNEICDKRMGRVGGCNEAANHLAESKHPAMTHQELCESLNVPWADAQAACAAVTMTAFKQACIFEYCNDLGKEARAAEMAQAEEEELEAAEAAADESHPDELNFEANACCADDPSCNKDFYAD